VSLNPAQSGVEFADQDAVAEYGGVVFSQLLAQADYFP
jgi:hypothetical protein